MNYEQLSVVALIRKPCLSALMNYVGKQRTAVHKNSFAMFLFVPLHSEITIWLCVNRLESSMMAEFTRKGDYLVG